MRTWVAAGALALICASPHPALAQQPSSSSSSAEATAKPAAPPPARASDVKSMNAIMHAVYDVISGPAGQARDWDRFRSLFLPGARLIAVQRDKQGADHALTLTPETFAEKAGPYMREHGFFERETHRSVDRYGAVAQVFSTYASRHAKSDAKPFQRGINSFQLYYDGHRWWVVTIYWQPERADLPIPRRYGG
ncbi:hypothetical protein LF63_0107025 [Oleiagrimonas soli]|uniref:SnoaL-like domain-containing protein n=1 Tax=Oleiagrimonas soli TaxID=1543381 RepID=A0A099CXE9_9GAMM|nr:hypothetical protein LF63_0107025 [Oleiagrimonas soli]